jgi:hypothetical protein
LFSTFDAYYGSFCYFVQTGMQMTILQMTHQAAPATAPFRRVRAAEEAVVAAAMIHLLGQDPSASKICLSLLSENSRGFADFFGRASCFYFFHINSFCTLQTPKCCIILVNLYINLLKN